MPRAHRLVHAVTALAATAAAAAALVAAAGPAGAANRLSGATLSGAAGGRCAPMTTRKIAGTLLGKDGLGLNATIGFDLTDGSGREIDATTGCAASGYGAILQLNHYVGAHGAPVGSEMTSAKGEDEGPVDPSFGLFNIPANVKQVFVETYTRGYTGSPCGLGCAGTVDVSKYGFVNRMFLPVGAASKLKLVADTTKPYGGDTGSIQVYVPSGGRVSMHAWSMSVKGNVTDEGWGAGVQSRSNPHLWTIPALSPGQEYTIIVDGYAQIYHIKVRKNAVTKVTA